MIWTEEQKAKMQRMKDELGMSNAAIGAEFNTSGDNIRKVLARLQKRSADPAMAEAIRIAVADRDRADSLRRLHDEFDAKVPERSSSRPQWAGRPPLRITPKDFQNG